MLILTDTTPLRINFHVSISPDNDNLVKAETSYVNTLSKILEITKRTIVAGNYVILELYYEKEVFNFKGQISFYKHPSYELDVVSRSEGQAPEVDVYRENRDGGGIPAGKLPKPIPIGRANAELNTVKYTSGIFTKEEKAGDLCVSLPIAKLEGGVVKSMDPKGANPDPDLYVEIPTYSIIYIPKCMDNYKNSE